MVIVAENSYSTHWRNMGILNKLDEPPPFFYNQANPAVVWWDLF